MMLLPQENVSLGGPCIGEDPLTRGPASGAGRKELQMLTLGAVRGLPSTFEEAPSSAHIEESAGFGPPAVEGAPLG